MLVVELLYSFDKLKLGLLHQTSDHGFVRVSFWGQELAQPLYYIGLRRSLSMAVRKHWLRTCRLHLYQLPDTAGDILSLSSYCLRAIRGERRRQGS